MRSSIDGADEETLVKEFPFEPKPYADLSLTAEGMNEHKSLVLFCENEDDDEQTELVEMIKSVAESMQSSSSIKFFYATRPGGMVGAARKAIKMENKMDTIYDYCNKCKEGKIDKYPKRNKIYNSLFITGIIIPSYLFLSAMATMI